MIVKQEQTEKISFLGISSIGDTHIKNGKPNQDAVGFNSLGDAFYIAVSDGLGSCKRAEIGAQTAVSICNNIFLGIVDGKTHSESQSILEEISKQWTQAFPESLAKEYSATLKVVFLVNDKIIALSVGDGFLFVRADDAVHSLENERTSFVNETACLHPHIPARDFATIEIEKIGSAFIFLCTDGISSGISEGREKELFETIAASQNMQDLRTEIENLLTEISAYNADDKTAGLVRYE